MKRGPNSLYKSDEEANRVFGVARILVTLLRNMEPRDAACALLEAYGAIGEGMEVPLNEQRDLVDKVLFHGRDVSSIVAARLDNAMRSLAVSCVLAHDESNPNMNVEAGVVVGTEEYIVTARVERMEGAVQKVDNLRETRGN